MIEPFGDVAVSDVVLAIEALRSQQLLDEHTVVNMSFGGCADEEMDRSPAEPGCLATG